MDHELKLFSLDLKSVNEEKLSHGQISVVFATLGVWDKDGDMALPGFYGGQDIAMLPAHDWSHVPIGKGRTREEGNLAIADIQMNLEIQAAKDWLSAIKFDLKNGKPIQEYSYGFRVLEGGSEMGEMLGRRGRILKPREDGAPGSKIWEVSPVLVGAGERTRTLSAKGIKKKAVLISMEACINAYRLCIEACEKCVEICTAAGMVACAEMCAACSKACKMCVEACITGDMTACMAACMECVALCIRCFKMCAATAILSDEKGLAACAAACRACAAACDQCRIICEFMAGMSVGKTFVDESQAVLDAADLLIERAKALAALREKDGRELSAPNKERLAALAGSFQEYAKTMASLVAPAPDAAAAPSAAEAEARRELVRMVKNRAGI